MKNCGIVDKTRNELAILYEISNAMRTTLKLDEILYIILTGVTAHIGLGFNRAVLFLVNEKDKLLEGKMAIGPKTGEEANRIWKQIEKEEMGLDDLISVFQFSNSAVESEFNKSVRRVKIPLQSSNLDPLAMGVQEGMPLHLTKDNIDKYKDNPLIQLLNTHELALVPLKAKDKVNGLIVADNFVTKEPITKDDIMILTMLGNQAGLAIQNSRLYESAVTRAHSDSLTELWNHGYFQYLLQDEMEKSRAMNSKLSLLMLDLDDFKALNDLFGHQAGDKVLKELAQFLKNRSRKMDYVCRYGGEEFTVILPQTDRDEAFTIAEHLRLEIEKHPFIQRISPESEKKLTVSIGIASFPVNGTTPSDIIAASDRALYQAKRKGKNTTCYV
ncbi:MAG: sensor domain-containing diguanylate cyclase [Elusimicrobia bacterium]|nr:sensor domain-containing diguanylate cyclase [Elusimicrobiota bacterium]